MHLIWNLIIWTFNDEGGRYETISKHEQRGYDNIRNEILMSTIYYALNEIN